MKILFIGDIVGSTGRRAVKELLPSLKEERQIDFVIANGENSAAGLGITEKIAHELYSYGVDLLTLGNHALAKSKIKSFLDQDRRIIRPGNLPDAWPGKGYGIFDVAGSRLLVINLIGRVGMTPAACPFEYANSLIDRMRITHSPDIIIIDFHAEATSEKAAMAQYLDGKAGLLLGTHTHVQTADERILPKGTAFISDVGMTGPYNSVIGMDVDRSLRRFVKQLPASYKVAEGPYVFSALLSEFSGGKAFPAKIERIYRLESQ